MKIWMLPFETNYSDFCRNYNGVGGESAIQGLLIPSIFLILEDNS